MFDISSYYMFLGFVHYSAGTIISQIAKWAMRLGNRHYMEKQALPRFVHQARCKVFIAATLDRKEGRMSIKSNAFGRVELTGADAKKFRNQVTYGRAKLAAKEAVARGVVLSQSLKEKGSVRLKLKVPA